MIEYRSFGVTALMAADEGSITGLAAPFNSSTLIGELPWGFREQIAPGAFSKTLQEADVVMLFNHDTSQPLARKSAGTLDLRESDRGLEFEADPAPTSYASDLRANIKAGNVRGMSFGFSVIKAEWTDDDGNPSDAMNGTNRILREVKLVEVSPCTFPAYETTDISARDLVTAAREARGKTALPAYADTGFLADKLPHFPLDTKKRVKRAWAAVGLDETAALYSADDLATMRSNITRAAKTFGITITTENGLALFVEWRDLIVPKSQRTKPTMPADGPEADADETRDIRVKGGTLKRIPMIHTLLGQSLDLFKKADISSLSKDAQSAVAMVSSAKTHSGHIMDKEKLTTADAARAGEPVETTPEDELDDALRAEFAKAVSREIALEL